jgi:beta-N-acetylhexosaminidase
MATLPPATPPDTAASAIVEHGPAKASSDPIGEILEAMTDEELLGQMIMLGFTGQDSMPGESAELFRHYSVGGVILFGWNVKSFGQVQALIMNINKNNPIPDLPIFIAIDEEGGDVSRFVWMPPTRSAETLGKRNDLKEVYEQYLRVGRALHEIGVNFNFAPVLDIASDPDASYMINRMYGGDADRVIPITNAVISGLHDGGVFSLGKHFPGHGGTAVDSHKDLPVIPDTAEELRAYALRPFKAAIDNGIDAILVGHLQIPALDQDYPASLSKRVITGLLREELGFSGIVFSDDMRMGAIINTHDIGEACVLFIEAGGDIVLVGKHMDQQKRALQALDEAVKSGRLTRQRLLESAYRIVSLKLSIKKD